MPDVHTPEQRSRNMSAIRNRNTRPELVVRSLVHRMGYRFRLHRRDLPGNPDLVFPARRKIIFVHGCFWHLHRCRYGKVVPATNGSFWADKRAGNQQRDRRNLRSLKKAGWDVAVVWECQTREPDRLEEQLRTFLEQRSSSVSGRRAKGDW
jgi:DNA mismatch endonuclease (patch repair protein)